MKVSAQQGIFYGWVIVLVSFLTLVLVMGTRFTFGVFYINILAEMGWSRASTAGIFSVSMLVYAVVALGVGAVFDRLGPRRMFPLAAVVLGIGFLLCSQIATLWQFYLYYGVIVGTGFTALGFIPHVSLVSRWFERRRGLATSLVLSGTGVGSLIFSPLSEYLVTQYGWQKSYLIYAVLVPTLSIPLMLIWHRNSPAELGLDPDGEQRSLSTAPRTLRRQALALDLPYTAALKTPAFWALFGVIFTIAFNLMTLIVHQTQYLVDTGFSQNFAAWMLGLSGIMRSIGSIFWGYLSDRTTREISFTITSLFGILAFPFLFSVQTSPDTWRVVVFVSLMGLGYGGTSVIYGTSAADLFQGRHFGKILGIMEIGFGLGASLGSYFAGVVFDHFHTYRPSFYIVMLLIGVSVVCIWIAAPRKTRQSAAILALSAEDIKQA